MKRILQIAGFILLAVILGAWAGGLVMMPRARTQPRYAGPILSPEADQVLRISCFDCHSNEAQYAWFDYMPVAASLVAYDVNQGRRELNFSVWDQYPDDRRARKLKEMREQIEEGEMPPWYYTSLHRDAALTAKGKQVLLAALPSGSPSEK